MRRITRNTILVILAVVVLLLALGALPSYLKSGDPYYVVATADEAPGESVNATNLSARRYRFSTGAVSAATANGNGTGRSDPYWRGPFGFKEGFTHSPFDEFEALTRDYPNATGTTGNDTSVYLSRNGTSYRVTITQTPGAVGEPGTDANASRLARPGPAGDAAPRAEVVG
ncbi:hypothetical protein [Haloglomus halophilum]|uniref:hypothetical protein n=1 Tax=Haloglomus halophilum TaxID=2962672 RepID=UPI0020C96FF1|nr:hypothetical protein [Haloglomus halophilum]